MAERKTFLLDVRTETSPPRIALRLGAPDQEPLVERTIDLDQHAPSFWDGLFRTALHTRRFAGLAGGEERLLAGLGTFLGTQVLGPEAMALLAEPCALQVRLPDPEADRLSAAVARIPWEMARAAPDARPLLADGLWVRAAVAPAPVAAPVPLGGAEPLRVLVVLALPLHARARAAREDRRALGAALARVQEAHRLRVDVLAHGVTRQRLLDAWGEKGGYHALYWVGHGHHDLLELAGTTGAPERLNGTGLAALLATVGGLPQLVVLRALRDTSLPHARDWTALRAAIAEEAERPLDGAEPTLPDLGDALQGEPGFAATALGLQAAGVPAVMATRGQCPDAAGRAVLAEVCEQLFGGAAADLDEALARAQAAVPGAAGALLLASTAPLRLVAPAGASTPRPPALPAGFGRELEPHGGFVGRGIELSRLAAQWLPEPGPATALVHGLPGSGKTALAAEAMDLWKGRFDKVIAFSADRRPLGPEAFYRTLSRLLPRPGDAAIHLPWDKDPDAIPEERTARMRANLVAALRHTRVLLVIDGFDAMLQDEAIGGPGPDPSTSTAYACRDQEWDRILADLARGLGGTGSRLLVTSRERPVTLLDPAECLWLPLGPLPVAESALLLAATPRLHDLALGSPTDQHLARRFLEITRGFPLLLAVLGAVSADPGALYAALRDAEGERLPWLPDLYVGPGSQREWQAEHDHLAAATVRVVDGLVERLDPGARRLLWTLTRAEEPVPQPLLETLWGGGSTEKARLREMKALVDSFPPSMRHTIPGVTPLMLRLLERLDPAQLEGDDEALAPHLRRLRAWGLVRDQGDGTPTWTWHPLVAARIEARVAQEPASQGDRTASELRAELAEYHLGAFRARTQADEGEAAVEAARRGFAYLVAAQAWDRLRAFAAEVVAPGRDPHLPAAVAGALEPTVDNLPRAPWQVRALVADAFRDAGQGAVAVPWYEQAEAEAAAAGSWEEVAAVAGNLARALAALGELDRARGALHRAAGAHRRAGSPPARGTAAMVEAARVSLMQGEPEQALDEVQTLMGALEDEAARPVLVRAYDVACQASFALERWEHALGLLDRIEALRTALGEPEDALIAARFQRYGPLLRLGRTDEADAVLAQCLAHYQAAQDQAGVAETLSAQARVLSETGDPLGASATEARALAVRNEHGEPAMRAVSHRNLADYLVQAGDHARARRHRIADLVYLVLAQDGQGLGQALRHAAVDQADAQASGDAYVLPTLAEVVAQSEFVTLRHHLERSPHNMVQVQQVLNRVLRQALEQSRY